MSIVVQAEHSFYATTTTSSSQASWRPGGHHTYSKGMHVIPLQRHHSANNLCCPSHVPKELVVAVCGVQFTDVRSCSTDDHHLVQHHMCTVRVSLSYVFHLALLRILHMGSIRMFVHMVCASL